MVKHIIIAIIILIIAYEIIVSRKKNRERQEQLMKAQERKKLKEEERQKAIKEYEKSINEKVKKIMSSGIEPVDSCDLILKKGEICYVNDKTRVLYGQFYGHDSIIVTNQRIIINRTDNLSKTKQVLVFLKDIINVSTVESGVSRGILSVTYYKSESGITDMISIHTHEDSRIIEAIIKKLINDMNKE